jgi:hypothetical protein
MYLWFGEEGYKVTCVSLWPHLHFVEIVARACCPSFEDSPLSRKAVDESLDLDGAIILALGWSLAVSGAGGDKTDV